MEISTNKKLVLLELVNILRVKNNLDKLSCFKQCEYQCKTKIDARNIDYLISTMQKEILELSPNRIIH